MLEFETLKANGTIRYTLADAKAWADSVISVDNTEIGWAEGGVEISGFTGEKLVVLVDFSKREAADEPQGDEIDDSADLEQRDKNTLKTAPTDTVLNLQYFFPSCDQALCSNLEREIIFVVLCREKSDQQRVRRYLSAMNQVKKRLCVCTVLTPAPNAAETCELSVVGYNSNDIGALLPLLCVGENRYARTADDPLSGGYVDLTVGQLSKNTEELSHYANGEPCVFADPQVHPQHHMLQMAGAHAIDTINEKIRGKTKKEETLRQREDMISEFWSIVTGEQGRLNRRPLLTQVIWLLVLRYLMELGELQNTSGSGDRHFLNDRIYLSLWDAVAYSEGILQLLENSEQHSQHHMGYLSVYVHDVSLKTVKGRIEAAERRARIFHKYGFNRSDDVVRTEENCCLEFNVTDMGRDKAYAARGVEVCSGKSLPNLFSGDANTSIEDVVHHYGMSLFFRTVMRKCGRFICTTPMKEGQAVQYIAGRDADKKAQWTPQYHPVDSAQSWTGYQILLPVSFRPQKTASGVRTDHGQMLDDTLLKGEVMPSDYTQKMIAPIELSHIRGPISAQEKIAEVERVCQYFEDAMGRDPFGTTVFHLKATGLSLLAFEICLKGFFQYIARVVTMKGNLSGQQPLLLFRLVLSDEFAIGEALRRFAIFYNRFGTNRWMKRVQVALCDGKSAAAEDMTAAPIRLVLAGENVYEAYITAKQYMYYNADLNSGFLLGQIEYLAQQEKAEKASVSGVPLFPFDLVKDEQGKSNFMEKVEKQLNGELQKRGYGCKIKDAHIRLGSKIHISDFYDAELLFQSVANVYRFAYLLAEQILKVLRGMEPGSLSELFLIGYENYSSLLVSEVKRLVEKGMEPPTQKRRKSEKENEAKSLRIDHLQFIRENDDTERIVYMGERQDWKFDNEEEGSRQACIIILPIGTTLSTIYKIRNIFQRQFELQSRPNILKSYALVVVENSAEGDQELSGEYWTAPKDGDVITLKPESSLSDERLEVQCFFCPKTRWMRPDKCELCGEADDRAAEPHLLERIPLGQVDKTSTIPRLVFPVKDQDTNHGIGFSTGEKNWEKLEPMKGCIEYGHIQKAANHFQFYIRYDEYYRRVREKCIKWLEEQRSTINENEFHIIISPLQYDNSLFVKDVIDHFFQHSLRFIYVCLDQAYREEFRSRFSYIAKEYQNACAGAEPPKYNVYYVDYSLVSGQSLRRSESLIRMLMNDAKADLTAQVFRKVILLTNRSSYDTAAVFVDNPKTDFAAFSTLRIPSYNTLSNHCPACEMVDVYQEIAKCCATNELYWYYQDLTWKHQLRTPEEHREWIKGFHFTHSHYLQSFCQSLYHGQDTELTQEEKEEVISAVAGAVRRLSPDGKHIPEITLQKVIDQIKADKIGEDKCPDIAETVTECYRDFVDGRNWRRLICTHEAMEVVENSLSKNRDYQWIRGEIWETIQRGLEKRATNFDKREWLISYIKVFSREYPAKIAPVRRAVFTLLGLLMEELLAQRDEASDLWQKAVGQTADLSVLELLRVQSVGDAAELLQLYQLYLTLAKRLCDLQSNLLLQYSVLRKVDGFLLGLRVRWNECYIKAGQERTAHTESELTLARVMCLPNDNHLQIDYLRLIKWAAMSSREDAKAFLLQQLSKELLKNGEDGLPDPSGRSALNHKSFGKVIQQENTRMLYSGIKRLDERVCTEKALGTDWESMEQAVENAWKEAKTRDFDCVKYLVQNPMADMFRFLDADWEWTGSQAEPGKEAAAPPYLERLTALLGFYRAVVELCEDKMLEERKDYVEKYFELCFYLSKIGGAKNCCIVHRTNGENQIISQYVAQEESQTALEKEIDRILYNVRRHLDQRVLNSTVCSYPWGVSEEKATSLVLALRIKRRADVKHLQNVYVVLFNMKEKDSPAAPVQGFSHYLLFMRQRLQMLLERDLYALHHFKTSLEDVGRIAKTKELCILHLTDLHISTHNKEKILKLIRSNRKKLEHGSPELMVVTGDIVQGNSTAIDLEANYQCAAEVLLAVAKILWPQLCIGGGTILRADWKKRIIIIPGNHDYASMNELTASHTLRTTTGGVPVLRNGSPMSKHSYFIQFLQDFLGVDSSRSIHRNLNSLLEFPKLNLRIIALNSVAEVGPLRNNKVQLDREFIEHLTEIGTEPDTSQTYVNIALAHHTRCYEPDYFSDRYWEKGLTREVCQLAKDMIQICLKGKAENEARYAAHPGSGGKVENQDLVKDIKAELEKVKKTRSFEYSVLEEDLAKSALFSDVAYVCEHWMELTNERCAQVFADYIRSVEMSRYDLSTYRERLGMLESVFPLGIMLGGHTHKAGRTRSFKEKGCVEGPRFYSEYEGKTQLNFGRLRIGQEGAQTSIKYEFSPESLEAFVEAKV